MAQEPASKEIANSRLRRLLAYNTPFNCAAVKTRDTVLLNKTQDKRSAPRWRGPELIPDIDETGVTVKFQSQTFKVARFCARNKVEATHVEDTEVDPTRTRMRSVGLDPGNPQEQVDVGVGMDTGGEDGNFTSCTGVPDSEPEPKPEASPAPDFPSFSVQPPSLRGFLAKRPDPESSFDEICDASQAPKVDRTQYDEMT